MIISLDLGTTHSKSAVFSANGQLLNLARIPSHTYQHPAGYKYYNPEEMWAGVVSLLQQITDTIDPTEISAIGITSMAETGLLVDNVTGKPRAHLLPWHDRNSITYVPELERDREPKLQFSRSGIRPTFKCSLAKLLWMRDNYPDSLENSTWLSAADYIGFRLAGMMVTDYSLAGRTYAFRIDQLAWDQACAAIRASAVYANRTIEPQLGLVQVQIGAGACRARGARHAHVDPTLFENLSR
jgi:xylulokinase